MIRAASATIMQNQSGSGKLKQHQTPSQAMRRDKLWGRLAIAGLLLEAVALISTYAVTVLQLTKAVPRADSPEVALLYDAYPRLLQIGALAAMLVLASCLVLMFRAVGRGERNGALALGATGVAALLGGGMMIKGAIQAVPLGSLSVAELIHVEEADVVRLSGLWWITLGTLALAAAIWAGRSWWVLARQVEADGGGGQIAACLRQTSWRRMLGHLPGIALSALLACVAIALPITWLTMSGMPGDKNGLAILWLTLCYAGSFGMLLAMAMQLLRWTWMAAFRAHSSDGRAVVACGVFSAVSVAVVGWVAINMAFGPELRSQKLDSLFQILLLIGGLFYGVASSKNLVRLCGQAESVDYGRLSRLPILAGALVPAMPLLRLFGAARFGHRSRVVGGVVILVAISLLASPLMKTGSVLFKKVNDTMGFLIVLLAVLLGQMLLPQSAAGWRRKCLLAIAGGGIAYGAAASSAMLMSEARSDLNTFSPLGRTCKLIMERVLPPEPGANESQPVALSTPDHQRPPEVQALGEDKPLIVLVIWDACRPDHMGLYGYQRPDLKGGTTPNLDRHRDELLRFTNCYSQATGTSCSMRHLFSGRFSSRWMLRSKGNEPFFTNDLLAGGYDTLHLNIIGSDYNGVSLDAFLRDMPSGLRDSTKSLFCNHCPEYARKKLSKFHGGKTRKVEAPRATPELLAQLDGQVKLIECNQQRESEVVEELLGFLETRRETRGSGVFAYIHMDATHWPWKGFAGHHALGTDHVDRYDSSIRYCDAATGRLIDGLEQLDMWDNTIFILAADHGTGLGEHRDFGGFQPWYGQVRVPLVMRVPGVAGREIDAMVGLFDIAPTLAHMVDEEALPRYEAYSLWPTIFGDRKWSNRVIFGMNSFDEDYYLITGDGLHYIRQNRLKDHMLFHWKRDPREQVNLWGRDKAARNRTRAMMNWFLEDNSRGRHYTDPHHYSPPPGQGY